MNCSLRDTSVALARLMYTLLVPQQKAALLSSTLGAWLSQVLFKPRVGVGCSAVAVMSLLIVRVGSHHDHDDACLDDVFVYWQSVFRPADDPRMDAAICAVMDFVEGPTVGGSRDLPIEVVFDLLTDPRIDLPDLGVAPNALLKAAIARGTATTPDTGCTTVDDWLSVGGCGCDCRQSHDC